MVFQNEELCESTILKYRHRQYSNGIKSRAFLCSLKRVPFHFSTDSNSAMSFTFYDTNIKLFFNKIVFFYEHFGKFQAKIGQNDANKTKNVFYKCVLESHFTSISAAWEAPFCQKSQNRCTLMIIFARHSNGKKAYFSIVGATARSYLQVFSRK